MLIYIEYRANYEISKCIDRRCIADITHSFNVINGILRFEIAEKNSDVIKLDEEGTQFALLSILYPFHSIPSHPNIQIRNKIFYQYTTIYIYIYLCFVFHQLHVESKYCSARICRIACAFVLYFIIVNDSIGRAYTLHYVYMCG